MTREEGAGLVIVFGRAVDVGIYKGFYGVNPGNIED